MRKTVLLVALAAVMVFSIAGFAVASTVTFMGSGSPNSVATNSTDPVEVKATVNPKISLTITTPDAAQEVLFGAVDPETVHTSNVNLQIKSNKTWGMTVLKGGDSTLLGLTTQREGGLVAQTKGTHTYADLYTINVPYTTDPANYTATVQYTVTQN